MLNPFKSSSWTLFVFITLFATIDFAVADQFESETNKDSTVEGIENQAPIPEELKDPIAVWPKQGLIPDGIFNLGTDLYFSSKALILDKSTRTLTLWNQTKAGHMELIKAYPSDYGKNAGDKAYSGDLKTPEGIYFFENTYAGKEINFNEYGSRAFTTNYPNLFDKRENKTGSGIWLHAIPETKSLNRGSRGCVVVRDEAINELYSHITLGGNMPILIFDQVRYIDKKQFTQTQTRLNKWLEEWRSSWTQKNMDKYMTFYSDDFQSQKMNKNAWGVFKESLIKKYKFINVKVSEPIILKNKSELVVRFLQDYQSDNHSDFGEKTLYLKEVHGEYKVIAEEWAPVSRALIASKSTEQRSTASKQN